MLVEVIRGHLHRRRALASNNAKAISRPQVAGSLINDIRSDLLVGISHSVVVVAAMEEPDARLWTDESVVANTVQP